MGNQKGFTLHELILGIVILLWLSFVGALIGVSYHFISKWW